MSCYEGVNQGRLLRHLFESNRESASRMLQNFCYDVTGTLLLPTEGKPHEKEPASWTTAQPLSKQAGTQAFKQVHSTHWGRANPADCLEGTTVTAAKAHIQVIH